jgi:site-specific DNA-cytosine methylase
MSDLNIDEIFARLDRALEINAKCAESAERRLQELISSNRPITPQPQQKSTPDRFAEPPQQLSGADLYKSLQSDGSLYNNAIRQIQYDNRQADAQQAYDDPNQYKSIVERLKQEEQEHNQQNQQKAITGYGSDYLHSQVMLTPQEIWALQLQRERGF